MCQSLMQCTGSNCSLPDPAVMQRLWHRLGREGGRPQTIQLAEWWADFDEKFMRPVFSRGDSNASGELPPRMRTTSQMHGSLWQVP